MDFLFFKKEQKYFYFTLAAREVTQTPVVSFTGFFLPYLQIKCLLVWESIENKYNDARTD